jgi:Kef-type K+ transport system membrane component KefB
VHLFLGAVLAATSVGITARVLKDLGRMEMRESKIILGAAVIDDILGLVVLAVASGAVAAANAGTTMNVSAILIIIVKACGFFAAAIILGKLISPKLYWLATYLRVKGVLLSLTLGWCFLLAWLGSMVGVAPIVGAFAAGLVLEDATFEDWHGGTTELEDLLRPITGFLVPVFFVHTGMSVQLATFANVEILGFAAVLTIFAIAGKQICSLGIRDKSLNKLAIGIGMIPRGEVGLIVANIGRGLKAPNGDPVISSETFSASVIMVVVTTMITPPALKWAMERGEKKNQARVQVE